MHLSCFIEDGQEERGGQLLILGQDELFAGKGGILVVGEEVVQYKIVRQKRPYDLVIANILAGTLIEMSDDMVKFLAQGGSCVLSGILNEQVDSVLSVYESYDLELKESFKIGEWTTLILRKP